MKAPSLKLLLLSLVVLTIAAIDTYAATLTVTKIEDTNDGVCDADCSLREAVIEAMPGDTVVFSSLFNSPQTITIVNGQITIDKNLTITGTGQNLLSLSGNNASRIFFITGSGAVINISGITFRDGNGGSNINGVGGAIDVVDSTLNVSNATFTNNTAAGGGGGAILGSENSIIILSNLSVFGNSSAGGGATVSGYSVEIRDSVVRQNTGSGVGSEGTVDVERCLVSGNTVAGVAGRHLIIIDSTITDNAFGGVSDGDANSTMTIERCLISGNNRFRPGGGVKSVGTTVIRDSQITNNSAVSNGGGIASLGTLYLINSVVSGNRSTATGFEDGGGGIFQATDSLYVINSTISGNTAEGNPGFGGGIYDLVDGANPNGRVYLVNSTIADNTSAGTGGGIRIDASGLGDFSNTIVAGNNSMGTSQEDVSGIITSNGINLIGNASGSSGWIAADLLNISPLLAPLGNNGGSTFTHALLPGSPAIDAGNTALAVDPLTMLPLKEDERGLGRIVGGRVDIGSYEASYSPSPVTVGGRIRTYSGRGIERTRIQIDDGQGNVIYTQTNPFGYYRLNNLIPGTTYTVTVINKLYLFTSPQFFTADQNRDDLNFMKGL
jgi:CSLREA domain-containing protein